MKINKRGKLIDIADLSLSYSGLKHLDKSIRHYIYSVENPPEQTEAMAFGSAFHCYVLEGMDKFNQNFAVAPECDKRTKEGKEKYASFVSQSTGKTIISQDQYKLLGYLENSVKQHPLASKILDKKGNKFEERFEMTYNKQKFTGVYDIVNTEKMFVADLKTCNSCSVDELIKDIANNKYYWQDLLYKSSLFACDIVNTEMMPEMYFIFVEKTAPFDCVVIQLNEQWVNLAMKEIDALVEKWRRFVNNTYIYSGISDSVVGVECPAYLSKRQGNPGAGKSNDEYQRQTLTLKKEVAKDEQKKEEILASKNEVESTPKIEHDSINALPISEGFAIFKNVESSNNNKLSEIQNTDVVNPWKAKILGEIFDLVIDCNLKIAVDESIKRYAFDNFKLGKKGLESWQDVIIQDLEDAQLASIKGFFYRQVQTLKK